MTLIMGRREYAHKIKYTHVIYDILTSSFRVYRATELNMCYHPPLTQLKTNFNHVLNTLTKGTSNGNHCRRRCMNLGFWERMRLKMNIWEWYKIKILSYKFQPCLTIWRLKYFNLYIFNLDCINAGVHALQI